MAVEKTDDPIEAMLSRRRLIAVIQQTLPQIPTIQRPNILRRKKNLRQNRSSVQRASLDLPRCDLRRILPSKRASKFVR